MKEELAKGSCFWGHKWTKWRIGTRRIRTKLGEGVEEVQRRDCVKCGKTQESLLY